MGYEMLARLWWVKDLNKKPGQMLGLFLLFRLENYFIIIIFFTVVNALLVTTLPSSSTVLAVIR